MEGVTTVYYSTALQELKSANVNQYIELGIQADIHPTKKPHISVRRFVGVRGFEPRTLCL